jgi:hypothetical protein
MCGVDVTKVDGIDETTALNIVAEVGTDLSRPLKYQSTAPGPSTRMVGLIDQG